jgi:biopolymer transport protein ExbD
VRYESHHIPKEVMLHEETHAKQLHSLDVIILELLQIAFWFHPLVYILKHHVKLNHEFLADQAVLKQGVNTKTYQNILLQFSSNTQDYQFSSAINYSSIKKRFTVMKTQTSKTRVWLSTLLVLPIIAILFYSFAEKEYVEKEQIDPVAAVTKELQEANKLKMTYVDGATPAMMAEYNDWIKKLNSNSSSLFIPVGTWERLGAIYDLMSEAQRNSVETHPFLQATITPSVYKVKASIPTAEQFESWKNEKEFAIWLDGRYISNSELNNYKISDIAHYIGSSVHSNAKSKKFPQSFQFNLYTKDGFNKFYIDAFVNDYKALIKTYSNAINTYLNGSQTDNSELRILKAQADQFYNSFTKEEKEKYHILPFPPVPAQKNSKNATQLKKYLEEAVKNQPIMVILINRKGQLLVDDELGSLKSIELKLKTLSESYDKSKAVYVKYDGTEDSYKIIREVKSLIRTYNFKIIQADTSQIAPPPPPAKQKTSKGGPNPNDAQSIYNPSFLEFIIEMENEGASFYLDDEKISAKEAKAIAANNKGKRTDILTQLDANEKYVVKLSNRRNNVSPDKEVGEDKETQEKPTAKEVAEYNAWAKKINITMEKADANPKEYAYPIVKYKDVEKHKRIYNSMTTEQKKNAEPFPKSPPPPPPAKEIKPGIFKTVSGEIIEVVEDPQPQEQESILPMVNGKTIKTGELTMTLGEIKNLKLTLLNNKIINFKLKIPGIKTELVKGNTITKTTLKNLLSAKTGDYITLFDIKDDKGSKFLPIAIEIIENP